MSFSKELVTGAFFLFAGGLFLYKSIAEYKRFRKVKESRKSRVASAPEGYVEIEGFAWPFTDTVDSIDGFKAVYRSVQIQRLEHRGDSEDSYTEWVTIFEKKHDVPFYVFDGTGAVLINPVWCHFDLDEGNTRLWNDMESFDQQRIISLIGTDVPDFPPVRKLLSFLEQGYRVIENEIYVGSTAYIHGVLTHSKDKDENVTLSGLTHFLKSVFVDKTNNLKNKATVFDTDGDGVVSAKESQLGYATIAKNSLQEKATEKTAEKPFPLIGKVQSNEHHLLLIADLHKRQLTNRIGHHF